MNYKNIIKCLFVAGTLSVSTSSCSDWLEVDMEDSILETTLFSTNEGFLTALNGVYSSLNNSSLYGGTLGMVGIDIMAQYYNVPNVINQHNYYYWSGYNYTDNNFDNASNSLWSNMYSLIANVNLLLEKCDEPDAAILDRYYPLVKGEALALRGMMHFDLLRFYGPIYSDATASQECLPYQEDSRRTVQPLISAEEFLNRVIRDLDAAAELLKECDPVLTEGVKDGVLSDDGLDSYDWSYRQLRLNYYAVQALRARAYLWKGDKATAYDIAKNEVIAKSETEQLDVFPWMDRTTVQETIENSRPDYVFSDEVMFSLYNMSRDNLYDNYFSASVNANNRRYSKVNEIAKYLVPLIPAGGTVMTQCFGETIVGMMLKEAKLAGKDFRLFCPETRPYFQGARLTATVCRDMGFDVTVITDNMPAFVMEREHVDLFTCAADAICLDGYVVNKVGGKLPL